MDPNTALTAIHAAIAEFNKPDTDGEEYLSAVDDLIESFKALDEWLAKGGFLPDAWNRTRNDNLAALMNDWLAARTSVIGETSSSITADYRRMIAMAKVRATKIGLTWTDDFLPQHVRDDLEWAAEQEADER
jgi:hypothetical protein